MTKLKKHIVGSGGSSASGNGAVEAPDTLESLAYLSILDLIGEGQIGGLVNGAQSIFLDETQLQNADGTYNFENVTWAFRYGTQDQSSIPGFSYIETPYNVGVEVKTISPKTITITNPNADKVRAIVDIPALYVQNTKSGNIDGTTVQYKFSIATDDGPFVDANAWFDWVTDEAPVFSGNELTASTPNGAACSFYIKNPSKPGTYSFQPQQWDGAYWRNTHDQINVVVQERVETRYFPQTHYREDGSEMIAYVPTEGIVVRYLGGNYDYTTMSVAEIGYAATDEVGDESGGFQLIANKTRNDYGSYVCSEESGRLRFVEVSKPSGATYEFDVWNFKRAIPNTICTLTGKTRSSYQRSHTLTLPKPGSLWKIRMTRLTADSTSSSLENKTTFDSYIEIVESKLSYPNSALVGIELNAKQFSSVPARAYLVNGLLIRVPSNYDPVTHAYSGVWDGTFKLATSSNPAWVLYDLLVSTRYGLGNYIDASQVDKAMLYRIGRYCDELVDDGYGGQEPRFTINTVIQEQAEAYKLISDICSVFRGMGYWNGSLASFTCDMPGEPDMVFSPANVINGEFTYAGSSRRDRHSVAQVTWNDPEDRYKQKIEYVEDAELIEKFGIRKTDVVAFGCTSRGQANRLGRWILYTEKFESEAISFSVGIDSAFVLPGDLVYIQDPHYAGKRMTGRAVASTKTSLVLDAEVELTGSNAELRLRMPDGTLVSRAIEQEAGTHSTITWQEELSDNPVDNAIWLISEPNLEPMIARIIGMSQGSKPGEFKVACVEHDPNKFALIETGLALETRNTTVNEKIIVTKPENISVSEFISNENGYDVVVVEVDWENIAGASEYSVNYRSNGGNWTRAVTTSSNIELKGVASGTLELEIKTIGVFNVSDSATCSYSVVGEGAAPEVVANLRLEEEFVGSTLCATWDATYRAASYDVRVEKNDGTLLRQVNVGNTLRFAYTAESLVADGGPFRQLRLKVRAVTARGVVGAWAVLNAENSAPAKVTGVTASSDAGAISTSWAASSDSDIAGYVIHISKTSGFTPDGNSLLLETTSSAARITADAQGAALTVGTTYYLRVAAFDLFGKDGFVYSDQVAVEISAIPSELVELTGLGPENFDTSTAKAIADMQAVSGVDFDVLKHIDTSALSEIDTVLLTDVSDEFASVRQAVEQQALDQLDQLATIGEEGAKRRDVESSVSALTTRMGTAESNIQTVQQSVSTGDSALSLRIDNLTSTVGVNTAAIDTESAARANADNALSVRIDTLVAISGGDTSTILASLSSEQVARTNADNALSAQISSVLAVANAKSKTYYQTSQPSSGMMAGDLWFDSDDNNKAYRYSGSAWVAIDDSRIAANVAAISSLQSSTASADAANASLINTVKARLDSGGDIANSISSAVSRITAAETAISGKASATDLTNLTTTVSGNTSSITSLIQSVNGVLSQYSVATNVNGKVSGIRLINTGATSSFDVLADMFRVSLPNGSNSTQVFTVGSVGGVNTVGVSGSLLIDGSVVASRIDSRGLVVKDANGNIILGAGTALSASYAASGTLNSDLVPSISSAATTATWSSVTGSGKPQDNATFGATFGSNISGQITASNVSTYIADAAIKSAQIESLLASKIVAASLSAITANLGTITAGRAQNAANTNFVDFNASGTSYFMQAGNGAALVRADGYAEFNNVKVRGDILATSITSNTVSTSTIQDDAVTSAYYATGSSSAQLAFSVPSSSIAFVFFESGGSGESGGDAISYHTTLKENGATLVDASIRYDMGKTVVRTYTAGRSITLSATNDGSAGVKIAVLLRKK